MLSKKIIFLFTMKSDMKVKKLRNPILGVKVVDLLGGHVLGSRLFKR